MATGENTHWVPDLAVQIEVLAAQVARLGQEVELDITGTPSPCRLGLSPDGSVWLRIDCDPRVVAVDDSTAAVQFQLLPSGYRMRVAATAPTDARNHLFEETIQLICDGHPPDDAGAAAIKNWRELLARPAGALLSDKALVGLFGELEVLEILLDAGGSADSWTGWKGDHNDFRIPGLAIEVKTTTSADYRRVQIHGLSQLDDPQDGSELLLVLKRLEQSPEGRSVPELVDRLVDLGAQRSVLMEWLTEVGYYGQHAASYANHRFVSSDVALRRIDESHPRLVPSMLVGVDTSSVDKIQYELNLNGQVDADLDQSLRALIAEHLEAL